MSHRHFQVRRQSRSRSVSSCRDILMPITIEVRSDGGGVSLRKVQRERERRLWLLKGTVSAAKPRAQKLDPRAPRTTSGIESPLRSAVRTVYPAATTCPVLSRKCGVRVAESTFNSGNVENAEWYAMTISRRPSPFRSGALRPACSGLPRTAANRRSWNVPSPLPRYTGGFSNPARISLQNDHVLLRVVVHVANRHVMHNSPRSLRCERRSGHEVAVSVAKQSPRAACRGVDCRQDLGANRR